MSFLPLELAKFKGTYNGLFTLVERGTKLGDDYTYYRWTLNRSWFLRGYDSSELFPLTVNLYLKECPQEELNALLDRKHFLRIRLFYEGEDGATTGLTVSNLSLAGLKDPKYRELFESCPSSKIPCEINVGPLWHFLGVDQVMCEHREIHMGIIGISVDFPPRQDYIMGLELFGRDQYPTETTEEEIKANEEAEEIFIVRK